jgi:hypothetical protein
MICRMIMNHALAKLKKNNKLKNNKLKNNKLKTFPLSRINNCIASSFPPVP